MAFAVSFAPITNARPPFSGRPVDCASESVMFGSNTVAASYLSEYAPGSSQRTPRFNVSLLPTWKVSVA